MTAVADRAEAGKAAPGERYRRMLERGMNDYAFDADRFTRTLAKPEDAARIDRLVLATDAVNGVAPELDLAERMHALVTDPAYQLR